MCSSANPARPHSRLIILITHLLVSAAAARPARSDAEGKKERKGRILMSDMIIYTTPATPAPM